MAKLSRPNINRSMNIVKHNKTKNINSNVRMRRVMYAERVDNKVVDLKFVGLIVFNMAGMYRTLTGDVGNMYDFGDGTFSNPLPYKNSVYYKGIVIVTLFCCDLFNIFVFIFV
jgi:hypothetical protein